MCRNNACSKASAATRRSTSIAVGIEFPDLPGSDCVHKFHDGRPTAIPTLGNSRTPVKQRPIPILYGPPGRELIEHDRKIIGFARARRKNRSLIKAKKAVVADLRRL